MGMLWIFNRVKTDSFVCFPALKKRHSNPFVENVAWEI